MTRSTQLGPERRQLIMQRLRTAGGATIAEISAVTGASPATVHRDLKILSDLGAIERVRGGALLKQELDDPAAITERVKNVVEKEAIAQASAGFITDDVTSVFLEASTTVQRLVPYVADLPGKVFITNSPEIGLELSHRSCEVILIGGELRERTLASIGQLAIQALESLVIDLAFIGVSALDAQGLSCMNLTEAETKSAILRSVSRRIALCDSSKLGRRALASVGNLRAIDHLVTDAHAPQDLIEQFRTAGLDITLTET